MWVKRWFHYRQTHIQGQKCDCVVWLKNAFQKNSDKNSRVLVLGKPWSKLVGHPGIFNFVPFSYQKGCFAPYFEWNLGEV
jgi:hypothetical protein